MQHNEFIGMGHNPNGPDLPEGLGMNLAQNPRALDTFAAMNNTEKTAMISFIQGGTTGDEARARMNEAIARLNQHQTMF